MFAFLTCRNDPNAKGAGKQSFFRTVWIYTAIYLGPPDESVDDLAEHAIPSDTHHPEPRVKIVSQQVDEPYECITEEGNILGVPRCTIFRSLFSILLRYF